MMFPSDLTLRDYIAINAMRGLMTIDPLDLMAIRGEREMKLSELISEISYKVADKMLEERENGKAQSESSQEDDEDGIEENS